jgi:hypothetical protein
MLRSVIPGSAIFLYLGWSLISPPQFESCLPEGMKPTDAISVQAVRTADGGMALKKFTVNEKLIELKAHCKKGKLVDPAGREIRFYKLAGCWGNPPAGYQEILERQEKEINDLKKRYTVVEIPCDLSGSPKLIH